MSPVALLQRRLPQPVPRSAKQIQEIRQLSFALGLRRGLLWFQARTRVFIVLKPRQFVSAELVTVRSEGESILHMLLSHVCAEVFSFNEGSASNGQEEGERGGSK